MSIHSSLRGISTLVGERSVLTRTERLQILVKKGALDPKTGSAYRMPKVRTRFKVAGAKKAPKPEGAAAPAAGGATPAAAAAGAKSAAAPAKEAASKKK
jgi:small basic protein (TIGR04137 family)